MRQAKVLVNKKNNYPQLRLLFPNLVIADDLPIYSKYVFSTEDYVSESDLPKLGIELFLLQDKAGYPVDTQSGLCKFLSQIEYMQPSKIERLAKVKSFGEKEMVYAMYHEAISLKIANRSYLEPVSFPVSIPDLIKMPFYQKVETTLKLNPEALLPRLLTILTKFYSRDATLSKREYEQLSTALIGFNTHAFKKGYKLTGDATTDCFTLLSYLPNN